jgi:TPP-dependent pyruvate/acetoin dehydrogenase alpha subunit
MEYTPISAVIPVEHPAADRASAYGLDRIIVDGNDVDAMYEIAVDTVGRARRGEGPSMVEALTYRHKGHSRADPGKYRPDEEVAAWMARDPLPLYRARLEGLGFPATVLDEMERLVMVEVEDAAAAVRAAPLPDPTTLWTDLWANGGSEWRN